MKTHTLLTLLLLASSCKTETQGYIVNNLDLSLEDVGRDFDGDQAKKREIQTPPAALSAQVGFCPAAIATITASRPLTLTAVGVTLVNSIKPLPSWPVALAPQHLTSPACVRAQVWPSPAAMDWIPLVRPMTSTGLDSTVLLIPLPT